LDRPIPYKPYCVGPQEIDTALFLFEMGS
jgi:hypothetical protein